MTTIWLIFFGRRQRRAPEHMRDAVWTTATRVTLTRAVFSVAAVGLAIAEHSRDLILVALVLSMLLDVLDGYLARLKKAETILGAQLDGLVDRLTAALVLAGAVYVTPSAATGLCAAIVWLQYGVVEQLLNSQFLRFGLWSPDHFYLADEMVWRLNWSAAAKMASGVPVLLVAAGAWTAAAALALALIVARTPCYGWISRAARRLPDTEAPVATVTRLERPADAGRGDRVAA